MQVELVPLRHETQLFASCRLGEHHRCLKVIRRDNAGGCARAGVAEIRCVVLCSCECHKTPPNAEKGALAAPPPA